MPTSLSNRTVSVVVPCYKYAQYLVECVDSIVGQTYKVHEIIIVSDGSPDNTKEVAEMLIAKYPDHKIIYVEKENGGLSSARNAGIKASTGEYITCVDADDKLLPGAIEEHVRLMVDDLTIAQCALMEFGQRWAIMTPTHPTGLPRLLYGNTIYCNAMFTRKVWEAVGGYDESQVMRWGWEDYEFWVSCLAYGCWVNTSDMICLRYRVHGNNMTKMTTMPHWDDLKSYIRNKHIDLYEKYNVPEEKKDVL